MKKMRKKTAITVLILAMIVLLGGCKEIVMHTQTETTESPRTTVTATQTTTEKKPSSSDKLIALTYDDGPNASTTSRILDILERTNSTATFFVVGYNIEDNADVIRRAQKLGCEIGNHSDGHKKLTSCSYSTLRNEVDRPNELVSSLTGYEMKVFRAPGGNFKGVEQDIGMPIIQWSIDTEDWRSKDASNPGRTPEERDAELRRIADHVLDNAESGDIILMHDIYEFTADLSEIVIPELIEKGFTIVSVSEMYDAYGEKLEEGRVYYSADPPGKETTARVESTETLETGEYRVSTAGSPLNMRAEPDRDSALIAKIPNGDSVTVIKSVSGWSFVEANGSSGWVNSTYLIKK